ILECSTEGVSSHPHTGVRRWLLSRLGQARFQDSRHDGWIHQWCGGRGMTSGLLSKLMFLAVEGASSGFSFDELAQRFRAGKGGMYPIALCAIIALAIIVERIVVLYFSASISKDGFLRGLKKYIYNGDLDKAINYVAGQKNTPLTNVVKSGLMNVPKGEDEVQAALDEAALRETPKLEARTGYL